VPATPDTQQTVSLHIPADRGIGRKPSQLGVGVHQSFQVVIVQLIAPVFVLVVLSQQPLGEFGR
jgi:hypothetical protein